MRDGIAIAATVRLPPGKTLADGPFPTVIEYSGYATAAPHSLIDALPGKAPTKRPPASRHLHDRGLGRSRRCSDSPPSACRCGARGARGAPSTSSGCLRTTTATTSIQTVGAQPWALHHKVGMVGISYSGISQFEVAGTDPPDLAAITPLSSTDDLFSTGYPGGIYNNGFAESLDRPARCRRPGGAPKGGQPWATAEIATGDTTCLANQVLHPEAADSWRRLVGPGLEPGPVAVRPALAGGVGHARQGARVPGRAPSRTSRRAAVARADHRAAPRQERLRHHAQRHPHRLARPRHVVALARVPRHLRGRAACPRPTRSSTPSPPRSTRRPPAGPSR